MLYCKRQSFLSVVAVSLPAEALKSLKNGYYLARTIGPIAAYRYSRAVSAAEAVKHDQAAIWLRPAPLMHPVKIRHGTSDLDVFRQIFCYPEYSCLDCLDNVGLILDCGANVGYSSAYFLSRYPHARVIAVEPDYGNYCAALENLAAYGERVTVVHAGVWSKPTSLQIREEQYRDGREWTFQVMEVPEGSEGALRGVDIPGLMKLAGDDVISLLKVDIEGAEAEVFSPDSNCRSWLEKVRAIAIEIHDDSVFGDCRRIFFDAIREQP